jgi:hypothetical protein
MQASLTAERVPVASLTPYPGNPRRGDVDAIRESLRTNGQFRPIVVNRPTMQVLAGNHTLRAAKKLGWTEIAVTYVDVDDERAKRIVLADNRTNDLAGYDPAELVSLLTDLPSLEGTGYHQAALDELLDELAPPPLADDEVPPAPAAPRSRPGDLYALGPHRLICADAREPSTYARLLEGERASLLWTDPPTASTTREDEGEASDRGGRRRRAPRAPPGLLRRDRRRPRPRLAPLCRSGRRPARAHLRRGVLRGRLAASPDLGLGEGRDGAWALGLPLPTRADPLRL